MTELERLMIEAGREIRFPATPDLAARVAQVLPERPRALPQHERGDGAWH